MTSSWFLTPHQHNYFVNKRNVVSYITSDSAQRMSAGFIERTIKSLPSQISVACLHMNVPRRAQDDALCRLSISAPSKQVAYIMEKNIDSHEAFDRCTCYLVYTHWVVHDRNAAINIRYFHT